MNNHRAVLTIYFHGATGDVTVSEPKFEKSNLNDGSPALVTKVVGDILGEEQMSSF